MGKHARCPSCDTVLEIPEPEHDTPVLELADKRKSHTAESLYKAVQESVVGIKHDDGNGSGFFVEERGLIATNRHVVGAHRDVIVELSSSKEIPGAVCRGYREVDLAFIKVDHPELKLAQLAEENSVNVGQRVYAIGSPRGLSNTLTQGIVSAIGRYIHGNHYIQTDASINPGNSGGPLFNEYSQVVGVNTMIIGDAQGLGFSIPIEEVRKRLATLMEDFDEVLKMRYCGLCGRNSRTTKYCEYCGAAIDTAETSRPGVTPAPVPGLTAQAENHPRGLSSAHRGFPAPMLMHERPLKGLDAEEISDNMHMIAQFADKFDTELAEEFGATIYSERRQ